MNNGKKYVGVESVLNIYDPNRFWYYIPSFNGYEISNDGYVRSMKHYRTYPYGILITPKKDKNGKLLSEVDPIFELSDNNNERQRIHKSQLMLLALNNPYGVSGYPRATIVSDNTSRNDRKFIRPKVTMPPMDNTTHYAKFTIIEDGTGTLGMEKKDYQQYKCPIKPVDKNDNTFYGRTDCTIIIPE